jgi:hypothetical protein
MEAEIDSDELLGPGLSMTMRKLSLWKKGSLMKYKGLARMT